MSLTEYAVQHPSGGVYFPNAVMPFRGLLESEAYAHSLLCDLMWRYSGGSHGPGGNSPETPLAQKASDIAEGVRLWLMLQKETQNWESDPAYLNAVSSVLDGSESLKSSVIAVMTKNYMKPFGEIEASGNEMSIIRQWYKVVSGISEEEADSLYSAHANACEAPEGAMIKPVKTGQNTWMFPVSEGDTLTTGDKLVAEYSADGLPILCFHASCRPAFRKDRRMVQTSADIRVGDIEIQLYTLRIQGSEIRQDHILFRCMSRREDNLYGGILCYRRQSLRRNSMLHRAEYSPLQQ